MDKVFTNLEHVAWLREQAALKRPYWYGVYHLPCTEALLQKKRKQYPEHYTNKRMATYRQHIAAGQIAGDCVNGAIKGAVWSELGKREPVYKSHDCPDKSADGMFVYCKELGMDWGEMDSMPDLPGVAVRFKGHVGVYVGDGEVVEWRGFNYGCVVTKLSSRKWTHWYMLPWSDYGEGQYSFTALHRVLRNGTKGADVKYVQTKLIELGYDLGKWGADGEFGDMTEMAVTAFQLCAGVEADGKYGPITHAALLAEIEKQAAVEIPRKVRIEGGDCWIRTAPNAEAERLEVAHRGDELPYGGQTAANGWHLVEYKNQNAWVSGKYGKLI